MTSALVTGGSGSIGSAICRALSKAGHPVAVQYYGSETKAEALVSELSVYSPAAAVYCDVAAPDSVGEMFSRVRAELGPVGILVNCAGVDELAPFDTFSPEGWRRIIDVDLSGAFYCCREAAADMIRAKRGRIVNISSMWGQVGASCEVPYSAAKAGLLGLTKALAKELAPSGVTVNAVSPGAIEGGMMEGFSATDVDALRAEIPLGRLGAPDEVAAAVMFLIGQEYITGQNIPVNGGFVV